MSPEFRRRELVAAFDPIETELELGLKLGKTVGVDEYYQGLENFQREYMTNRTDLFDSISQRTISTSQLPRQIYTTAASSIPDLPIEFNSWIELNKGWKMGYFSDQGIEDWLEEMLSGSKVVEEFHQIKRGVLRADFFRYLIILLQGGLYTDTDTSCIRPIALWPGLYPSTYGSVVDFFNQTRYSMHYRCRRDHLVLKVLEEDEEQEGEGNMQVEMEGVKEISMEGTMLEMSYEDSDWIVGGNVDNALEEPPRLVVAIEKDAIAERFKWKGSDYTRGLQVHQWTLVAQPFHPVFIDAVSQIIKTSQLIRGGMPDPGALDYTGPSMFSDAVFKYLLVEYGVHPQQLIGLKRPTRIGDVLVLPRGSFQSPTSKGYQGENRLVWHGNHGESRGGWKLEEGWNLPPASTS